MLKWRIGALALGAWLLCGGARPALAQKAQTPCVPGISYWSLMGAVGVGYADGRLRLDKLYAVCLPAPARQSETNYAYNPDDGGTLATVVKRANGPALNTYVWYGENIAGLWELSHYKVVGGAETIKPLAPGAYELEFQLEGKPFYRFPFNVVSVPSDDPYQPAGPRYFVEGPWNEYGNIFYQRNDPESSLRFTTWVQDKAGHAGRRSVPYQAQVVRARDGKVLATDDGTLRLEPRWLQLDLSFRTAGGDPNAYTKAGELLREDGTYTVRLNIDGQPYGAYPFTVQGGKIQLQDRQVRERTDPQLFILDYLYGGRYTSWWIKRQPAAR
ncbi:MAG TPA: hypothetical protein VF546_14785 [Pyrinomonadaceae bacterium]|jgi:hypothetical protein